MLEMYAGVILFSTLYVNTALLYLSLLSTDNHPSSLPADGVRKSVLRIVLAARFCNFRSLSRFDIREPSPRQQNHTPSRALCNFGKTVFELLPVHIQIVALIVIF